MKKIISNLTLAETDFDMIMLSLQNLRDDKAHRLTWQEIRQKYNSHDLARAVAYFLAKEEKERKRREANTIVIELSNYQSIN